jgi:pyruvate/2-oxoglutarate dehydrogenase complex dihydrolipoamide dehydrogenase (E3) component
VIAAIAPNDSVERFTGLGVKVIRAAAEFADRRMVIAGDHRIMARRVVVATGSAPAIPPIPGIEDVPYFTNETIFQSAVKIEHLIIIGGGPIGIELAQAMHRLGTRVTVLEAMTALAKDDPELTAPLLASLRQEGLVIAEGVKVERLALREGGGVRAEVMVDGRTETIDGSHLLVAAGRRPRTEGLRLEKAGIRFDRRGIAVSSGLLTSNRRVYAIGDVAGGPQFTHVANYHAGIVVRRALFWWPAKVKPALIPWVTFTDPELAHVGLTEEQARQSHGRGIAVLRWPYAENDRAQAERRTHGYVKVVATRNGRILGATILGEHAGELIQMWSLALSAGLGVKQMTAFISPYPTYGEVNKRAATSFYVAKLANPLLRGAVGLLARLG